MKLVKHLLPFCRATSQTYHKLTDRDKKQFRKLWSHLTEREYKEVNPHAFNLAARALQDKTSDYLRKYNAMRHLSNGIIYLNKVTTSAY